MSEELNMSPDSDQLLGIARALAMETGWASLSTLHLFLAYHKFLLSENNGFLQTSVQGDSPFAGHFPTPLHFHTFREKFRIGEASSGDANLPIELPCLFSLRYAKCLASVLKSSQTAPHHIIAALLMCSDSDLNNYLDTKKLSKAFRQYFILHKLIPENGFNFLTRIKVEALYKKTL